MEESTSAPTKLLPNVLDLVKTTVDSLVWRNNALISYQLGGVLLVDGTIRVEVAPRSMSTNRSTWIWGQGERTADGKRLILTFGPHGLEFQPQATLVMMWGNLNAGDDEVVKLYYFDPETQTWQYVSDSNDTGNEYYIWDKLTKSVKLKIPHFSIYAFSKD